MLSAMISLRKLSEAGIKTFIAQQKNVPFSYPEVGASQTLMGLSGYNVDCTRTKIGEGESVFIAACKALQKWKMFANGWTHLCWNNTPIKQGEVVAMLTKVFGIWWANACRIVYVVNEIEPVRKFGFAYGTLPTHAECGEERFIVEWNPEDNSVWFEIAAFSRPRHWMVKLAYPLARRLQKKFVCDAMQAMQNATAK